jgi:hypothetical protein
MAKTPGSYSIKPCYVARKRDDLEDSFFNNKGSSKICTGGQVY